MSVKTHSFFRNLLHKRSVDSQLDAEYDSCFEMLVAEKIAAGVPVHEARRVARIELGGADQVKESVRDVRAGAAFETFLQDVRFGARMIRRNLGFSLLVIVTLALGIGANTAIFSVVYGVLLRPLPYARGSDLIVLHQQATKANIPNVPFSVKEIEDYRSSPALAGVVEYHSMSFLLLSKDSAERVQTGVVSHNFFDVLGVKPLLGRTFLPSDESPNADAVLVLSYNYWQQHLGGDPKIVGRVFEMNDRPHTVIGVLPPIPQYPAENDVYMPTSACPYRSSKAFIQNRKSRMMTAFARLKPGVSLEAAQANLSLIAHRLETTYPDVYPKQYGYGLAADSLRADLTNRAHVTLLILLAVAGFVLLIACANVANLMLSRMLKREREFAVRSALGASKARIIRQLLTEAVLLSLAGGVLGLLLAPPALAVLVRFTARFTTRAAEVGVDWHVLIFTLLVSVFAGLLFGVAPAISSGSQLADALKQGAAQTSSSRDRQHLRSFLIVTQVAISFLLLIGAGLMLRTLWNMQQTDPGFGPDHLLTMRLSPNFNSTTTNAKLTDLTHELLRRVRSVSGVESAAMASNFPFNPGGIVGGPGNNEFEIEGRPESKGEVAPTVDTDSASPGFFETIRQPLIVGRTLQEEDDVPKAPLVAVINQSMAHHRWPTGDAIGKRVSFDHGEHWVQIVGIVGDVKEYGITRAVGDEMYLPPSQSGYGGWLVVRTARDPESMGSLVKAAVHSFDSQIAIDHMNSVDRLQQESFAPTRTIAILMGIFAALAVLISATGIAGVMALSISQRTRELGVRMALGQSKSSLIRMLVRHGLALAVAGTILGIGGALVLGQLLSSLLYHTSTHDVATFALVSLLFLVVATVACMLPARRITRIDPCNALRQE
ncbi:MAG TPA: ABC transporter permease [Terriglobales bacterium]|nr:ABC transporter permease [Terriglobales bacterium]